MYDFNKIEESLKKYFPDKLIYLSYSSFKYPWGGKEESFYLEIENEVDMVCFSSWKEFTVFCNKLVIEEYCKVNPGAVKTSMRTKDVFNGRNFN